MVGGFPRPRSWSLQSNRLLACAVAALCSAATWSREGTSRGLTVARDERCLRYDADECPVPLSFEERRRDVPGWWM